MAQDSGQTVPYGDPGVGGVSSAPASSTMAIPDLLQSIKTLTQELSPGGAAPYTATTTATPRMPVPMQSVPTNQNTQITPADTSLYARRTAKQQSMGNLLGNMIGMVANQKMQERNEAQVATIKDYGNANIQAQEAKRTIAYYKGDPNNPAVQEAQAVLAKSNLTMQTIQNNPKEWRAVEKAYKNYKEGQTDPTKMDQEGKNWQAGVSKAVEGDVAGRNNEDLAQANTSARADAIDKGQASDRPQGAPTGPPTVSTTSTAGPQGIGYGTGQQPQGTAPDQGGRRPLPVTSPATGQPAAPPQATPRAQAEQRLGSPSAASQAGANWRPAIQLPVTMTPSAEAAQQEKFKEAIATSVLRSVAPAAIRADAQRYKTDADNARIELTTRLNNNTKLQITDKNAKERLDAQTRRDATSIYTAQLKAQTLGQTAGRVTDPRTGAVLSIAGNQQLKAVQTEMDKITGDISKDEGTIDKMEKDAELAYNQGQKARGDQISDQIKETKARIDQNNYKLNKLGGVQDDLIGTLGTLPGGVGGPNVGGMSDQDVYNTALGRPMTAQTGQPIASSNAGVGMWAPLINQYSQQFGVDPNLAAAVMQIESGGKADAVSKTGVVGPMQLTKDTATRMGVNRDNPIENIQGGIKYLGQLLQQNNGDVAKALSQYGDIKGDPQYVNKVMREYNQRVGIGGGGTSAGAATNSTQQQPAPAVGGSAVARPPAAVPSPAQAPTSQTPSTGLSVQAGELGAINRLLGKTGGQ